MNLADAIENAPLLRISGEPPSEAPVALALHSSMLPRLPALLEKRKDLQLGNILIVDLPPATPVKFHLPLRHGRPAIECGLTGIANPANKTIVFPFAEEWLLRTILFAVPDLAKKPVYIIELDDPALGRRAPASGFAKKHMPELLEAWNCLASEQDRTIFAARIKALESGDPGYLPLSSHPEYEHPLVSPAANDIMIDCGLSDMVEAQKNFAGAVGPGGVVHGFEPIRWMAESASKTLAPFANYHVHPLGVADREGQARFASLRDSSHIAGNDSEQTEICRLTTIDRFRAENNIPHIDCIKMDVEGAELAALKGAAKTIRADRPKLVVCLYHKPRDIFEIPLWLRETAQDYTMFLGHSSCGFTDTILYASTDPALRSRA